jgi:hypothetical protein
MVKEAMAGAGLGAVPPIALSAVGVAPPPDALWWAPYVISGVFGLVSAGVIVAGNVYLARKNARAEFVEQESARMLADDDKSNDDEARRLALEAKIDRATGEAIQRGAEVIANKLKR